MGDIEAPRRACPSRVSDPEGHRTVSARGCGPRTEAEDCLVRERAVEDGPTKVRDPTGARREPGRACAHLSTHEWRGRHARSTRTTVSVRRPRGTSRHTRVCTPEIRHELCRIRSDAAFAKLCGACPIPASSGVTNRHRLFRGGHRQANATLYRIVIVRMRWHQPTIDYVARRTAQGLSKKDIIRCLKRFVAREIYNALIEDHRLRAAHLEAA